MAYISYRVFLPLLGKDNYVMAEMGAKYLSVCHYAKRNLSLHHNKPSSSHGFSSIFGFLWQSAAMSPFSKENCERLDRICQSQIQRLHLPHNRMIIRSQSFSDRDMEIKDVFKVMPFARMIILKQCSPIPKPVLAV